MEFEGEYLSVAPFEHGFDPRKWTIFVTIEDFKLHLKMPHFDQHHHNLIVVEFLDNAEGELFILQFVVVRYLEGWGCDGILMFFLDFFEGFLVNLHELG